MIGHFTVSFLPFKPEQKPVHKLVPWFEPEIKSGASENRDYYLQCQHDFFFVFIFLLRCAIKLLSYKISGFVPIKMAAFQFAVLFWVYNAALLWLQLINLPKAQYENWAAICVLINKVCFLSLQNDWLCCFGDNIPCEQWCCLRQEMWLKNITFQVTSLPSNQQTPLWNVCTDGQCNVMKKSLSNIHKCTAAEQ